MDSSILVRLQAAEDRLAILDLEGEYARSWDCGDGDAWAALFTADGSFEMTEVGNEPARTIQGTAQLIEFCRQVDSYYRGLHFMSLPRVEIAGDTAHGQLHFQWLGLFRPNAQFTGERHAKGFYRITYRKIDGQWKIARRTETIVSGAILESYNPFISKSLDNTK